jgi:hypothetical protein
MTDITGNYTGSEVGLWAITTPLGVFQPDFVIHRLALAEAMSFLLLPSAILVTVGQAVWLRRAKRAEIKDQPCSLD